MNDEKLLKWAEFVATKFSKNAEGWTYSRNTGGLKHIRYESDYTGYNHWTKRLARAFNLKEMFETKNSFLRRSLGADSRGESLKIRLIRAWYHVVIHLRKDSNLPDGQINGIITHWEEDGEYIALFQPRVGVKVLEFIKANPDNEYARAILDEMHACKELSWPSKESNNAED